MAGGWAGSQGAAQLAWPHDRMTARSAAHSNTTQQRRYGGLDDSWSIHDGSCWHSYLGWDVKTGEVQGRPHCIRCEQLNFPWQVLTAGWDVAAMPDTHPDARHGIPCGKCYEIRCRDAEITDGYVSPMATVAWAILSTSSAQPLPHVPEGAHWLGWPVLPVVHYTWTTNQFRV